MGEFNPEQLTEALARLVSGVQVEELYTLEALEESHHLYAVILLYQWLPATRTSAMHYYDPQLVFWPQALNRPTLSQALLTALLNLQKVDAGPQIAGLRELLLPLDPETKTQVISASPLLTSVAPQASSCEGHYAVYVPLQTKVYELAGLNAGPVSVAEFQDEDWPERLKPYLTQRLAQLSELQVPFSLLTLSANRKELSQHRLSQLHSQLSVLRLRLNEEIDPERQADLLLEVEQKEAQVKEQTQTLQEEEDRSKKWTQETSWRKHNYVPFVLRMLEKLETRGLFPAVIRAANRRAEKSEQEN